MNDVLDDNLPTLETVCAGVENRKLSCHKSCLGPKWEFVVILILGKRS